MYNFIGDINDTKAGGLESLLNYMNENFFSKDEPATNEHHYRITKKQYNEETNTIYNIDKSKTFNIKNNRFLNNQYFHKKQNINNSIINNTTKKNIIHNNENVLNLKRIIRIRPISPTTINHRLLMLKTNLYKKQDSRTFNNTNNI